MMKWHTEECIQSNDVFIERDRYKKKDLIQMFPVFQNRLGIEREDIGERDEQMNHQGATTVAFDR